MPIRWNPRDQLSLAAYTLKWFVLAAPVSAAIGSAVAFFLWSLDRMTATRFEHPWLLYLLPVAGAAIGTIYHLIGKPAEGGNNLIVEQIHEPGGGVPARMTPLVLGGTLLTHLFGGSAGREGTAVQMGGSMASTLGRLLARTPLALGIDEIRILLMCGVAAGFGSVFGTPLTGAVFALEVIAVGQMNYKALVPCLIASIVGDWTCTAWQVHHTQYRPLLETLHVPHLDPALLGKTALAAVAFGLGGLLFAELAHGLHAAFKKIPHPALRPVAGGLAVLALTFLLGRSDYLGLGVTSPDEHAVTIVNCFKPGGADPWSWWWKLLFTTVTVSSGFKGGEVTPLFFIGAALGHTLSVLLGAPVELFAALGFVAVFSGATNTPLACTIMGVELFGHEYIVYFAAACFVGYLFSGHHGIYLSQKIGTAKPAGAPQPGDSLRSVRDRARSVLSWFSKKPRESGDD
ncbi:MAG: voltage-gated chloride channel family protein [Planctomycetota bacterium]|nr:voltage-gated chloride channel family protein [Planctomycetota bacterium]